MVLYYVSIEGISAGQGVGNYYMLSDNERNVDCFRLELLKLKSYIQTIGDNDLQNYQYIESIYIIPDNQINHGYCIANIEYNPLRFNKLKKINYQLKKKKVKLEELCIVDNYQLDYVYNTIGLDTKTLKDFNILFY